MIMSALPAISHFLDVVLFAKLVTVVLAVVVAKQLKNPCFDKHSCIALQ